MITQFMSDIFPNACVTHEQVLRGDKRKGVDGGILNKYFIILFSSIYAATRIINCTGKCNHHQMITLSKFGLIGLHN